MSPAEPPRVLGGLAAFSIVAGSMLGAGIFLLPAEVARATGSLAPFLALWVLGGVAALSGAVACGELGAMMPRSGGDYVFQRAAFGPSVAFASGWVLFAGIFAGSIAGMAVAVFQFQVSQLLGLDLAAPVTAGLPVAWQQLLAIVLILLLTGLNDAGTRWSGRFQTSLTLVSMALITVASLVFLAFGDARPPAEAAPSAPARGWTGWSTGFLFVYFTFSGWLNIIYVGGEVERPARTIPRSMISAVLAITALYLLMNGAFLTVLGLEGLGELAGQSVDAGTGVARALDSSSLETAVLLLIAVILATSLNATVLASARVGYAMARDRAFWRGVGRLHPRRSVPQRALWIQAAISSALVLTGTFEEIIRMTSLAMLVTGFLTVLALFVLRRREPEAERPYRASGYPWFPGLYLAACLLVMGLETGNALTSEGPDALFPLIGIGVFLTAWLLRRLAAGGVRPPGP